MDGKLKREVLAVQTRAMTKQEVESEKMNVKSEQTIAEQIVLDETEEIDEIELRDSDDDVLAVLRRSQLYLWVMRWTLRLYQMLL